MMSSGAPESVLADLTCSLCLSLFETPKIMPNCPHTFCLKCLQQVQTELTFPPTVLCPECRSVNYIGRDGIDGFSTNIVVQNVAEKMKETQRLSKEIVDADVDSDMCIHLHFTDEQRQLCRHCNKQFCHACKFRHMEMIKDKITEIAGNYDDLSGFPIKEVVEKVGQLLQRDIATIDAKLSAVCDALSQVLAASIRSKAKNTSELLAKFAESEATRLRALIEQAGAMSTVADSLSLMQRRHYLVSVSIFKQDLEDVAQLFLDITQRMQILESIQQIGNTLDSSLLTFSPASDFAETVDKFVKSVQLGCLKINKAALDSGCAMFSSDSPSTVALKAGLDDTLGFTAFVDVGVQTEPITPIKRTTGEQVNNAINNKRFAEHGSISISEESLEFLTPPSPTAAAAPPKSTPSPRLEAQTSAGALHPSYSNVVQVSVSRPASRIISLSTRGVFAVSHQRNKISMFRPSGEFVDTFAVLRPSDIQRMEIEDIAADCRSTFFFSAQVKDDEGRETRRIYRFWMNEFQPAYPTRFAIADCADNNAFRGIAISVESSWVITTEADSIVAYESINKPRSELGTRVMRWALGPNPFLHAVDDYSTDCLKIICSSDGYLRTRTLFPREASTNRANEEVIWHDGDSRPLHINKPTCFCYWNEKSLVVKGGFLQKYVNVMEKPELAGTFPASLYGGCPANIKGIAALEMLDANQQALHNYFAILSLSDVIALAQLND